MNEKEKKEFIKLEIEAIYEEFDYALDQLVLLRHFFKELISVSKDSTSSKKVSKTIKRIK